MVSLTSLYFYILHQTPSTHTTPLLCPHPRTPCAGVRGMFFLCAISCANPCAIFAISSCYAVSGFISSYSLIIRQTIDMTKKNPEAMISQSFGIWWRRGESNPRPKTFQRELLRAQSVIYIPLPKRGPTHSGAW